MDEICFVKLRNSLRRSDLEKKLADTIKKRIVDLPNHGDLRLDPELVLLVCNLVENTVFNKSGDKKKLPIDKKRMAIRVLDSVFTYSEFEKKQVDQTVEFLHINGQIKKVSMLKKFGSLLWAWLKKKVL